MSNRRGRDLGDSHRLPRLHQTDQGTGMSTAEDRQQHAARFGQFLRSAKLKQAAVARKLGVSPSFVADIIGGRKRITQSVALCLELLYGVNANWLLDGSGSMTSPLQDHLPEPNVISNQLAETLTVVAKLRTTVQQVINEATRLREQLERAAGELGADKPITFRNVEYKTLSARLRRVVWRLSGHHSREITWRQIAEGGSAKIIAMQGIGDTTLRELRSELNRRGLQFADE
jgi:transcriptional regulator with XRE-family HTH domain